jgi:phosphoglycolate phosphatase
VQSPVTFLFDMDGTLLDSSQAVLDAVAAGLRKAYMRHGLMPPPPDFDLIKGCMGLPSKTYFQSAFPPDTVPQEMRRAFSESFGELTEEAEEDAIKRGKTALFAEVPDTLDALRGRGHRLLLFSNAGRRYFDAVVKGHNLKRWFARTISLEEAVDSGLAQDKPGMVRALIDDPQRCVVVGDRIHDIEAGKAAGTLTVGCLYGFGEPNEFRAADWIIDSPKKLLELPLPSEA